MPNINLHLGDCLEAMKAMEDNQFDLAIVDPPYGIDAANEKRMQSRHHSQKKYKGFDDTNTPDQNYFDELFRISKNQIIWGGNYFISKIKKDSSCWIFWDKDGYGDFADGELAWTSFTTAVRKFKYTWNGFRRSGYKNTDTQRFHPTEKPASLYEWLLKNYAKPGDKILDTHAGSFSIGIACHDMGFDLEAYEIDEDYYTAALKRFKDHTKQLGLFQQEKDLPKPEQTKLL